MYNIGLSVKLFGEIEIGSYFLIGANSVVTKSFPISNVPIAGVPARIIKECNANEKVIGISMCGIVRFTGHHQAAPILLDGLLKIKYRSYYSAAIAVRDGNTLAEGVKL